MSGSEKVTAAYGTIQPHLLLDHHSSLLPNHVKVTVDDIIEAFKDEPVPAPSQAIKKLRDAHGAFTQWPKHLVSIVENKVNTSFFF